MLSASALSPKSDAGREHVGKQQIRSVIWEKTAEEAESPPKDTKSSVSQGGWHLEPDVPLGGDVCAYQSPQLLVAAALQGHEEKGRRHFPPLSLGLLKTSKASVVVLCSV